MKNYYTDSIELFSDLLTQIEQSNHKNYAYLKDDFKHLKTDIISYICKQNLDMLATIEKETLRDHLFESDYKTFQQLMLCLNDASSDDGFSSLKNQKFEEFLIKTEYNYGDLLAKLLTIRNILLNNLMS